MFRVFQLRHHVDDFWQNGRERASFGNQTELFNIAAKLGLFVEFVANDKRDLFSHAPQERFMAEPTALIIRDNLDEKALLRRAIEQFRLISAVGSAMTRRNGSSVA